VKSIVRRDTIDYLDKGRFIRREQCFLAVVNHLVVVVMYGNDPWQN
jgi:hypothetical protein